MSTGNDEKKTKSEVADYQATDADLPKELWPAAATVAEPAEPPRRKRMIDAQYEATRQLHELGIAASNQEIDLCALVLYCAWDDEHGGSDG